MNPAAGGGRCGRRAPKLLERLRAAGLELQVQETSSPRDGIRLADEAWDEGFRSFLAIGGDGTTWEVLNGVMPRRLAAGERVALGSVPLGTGNSFLRDFTSEGATHVVRSLVDDRRRDCDVLRLDHRDGQLYFVNLLGWGFAAEVAAVAARLKRWGALGYLLAVLRSLLHHRPESLPFRCDGGEALRSPSTLTSVCNSRFTGGAMMMAPAARTDDGLADVIHVGSMGTLGLLAAFPRIYRGSHLGHPAVSHRTARKIDFETDRERLLMIDGELVTVLPESLEVLPRSLEIWA